MYRYAAFISYKSQVGPAFVESFELAIRQYAKPLFSRPIAIFRDARFLPAGVGLESAIRAGLEQSEYLILIASPKAASSSWVVAETEYWCSLGRVDRLIIVLLDGQIHVDDLTRKIDWKRTDALPPVLQRYLHETPLFVDFRWASQSERLDLDDVRYRFGVNKVVARLRGIDPNEMSGVEVQQHKRNIRLRNGAISLLGLLGIGFTYASFTALSAARETEIALATAAERQMQNAFAFAQSAIATGDVESAIAALSENSRVPDAVKENFAMLRYETGQAYSAAQNDGDADDDDIDSLLRAADGLVAVGWYSNARTLSDDLTLLGRCEMSQRRLIGVSARAAGLVILSEDEATLVRTLEGCVGNTVKILGGQTPHEWTAAVVHGSAAYGGTERGEIFKISDRHAERLSVRLAAPVEWLIASSAGDHLLVSGRGGVTLVSLNPVAIVENHRTDSPVTKVRSPLLAELLSSVPAEERTTHRYDSGRDAFRVLFAEPSAGDEVIVGDFLLGPNERPLASRAMRDEQSCLRLEWLEHNYQTELGVLKSIPVAGCDEDALITTYALPNASGGLSHYPVSGAFCEDSTSFVVGTIGGATAWMRRGRSDATIALEHVERHFDDSVSSLVCESEVVYASGRVSGIRKLRHRFRLEQEPGDLATGEQETRSARLMDALGRELTVSFEEDGGILQAEAADQSNAWRRRLATPIPYRTGAETDRIDALAVDPARSRVLVLTSYGLLYMLDATTGSTLATLSTSYSSELAAKAPNAGRISVGAQTGEIAFQHSRGSTRVLLLESDPESP